MLLAVEIMKIITFNVGDTLIMKKPHPCSSVKFKVLRIGSDIRIVCENCKRDITMPREKLEKMVKGVSEE